MKRMWFLLILMLSACGNSEFQFDSQLTHQPYLMKISPDPSVTQTNLTSITLTFSEELSPSSITSESLAILSIENNTIEAKSLWDLILAHKQVVLPGEFSLNENKREVTWHAFQAPIQGKIAVLITPSIQSSARIPFNQHPGEKPSPLMFIFQLPPTPNSSNSTNPPTGSNSSRPVATLYRSSFVLLNEIFYDSTESDTDGHAFIELYGEPEKDLAGYQVVLINGSDGSILDTITIPDGKKTHSNGLFLIADARTNTSNQSFVLNADLIDNFDPQNGPDALQILDDQGHLLDSLTYGVGAVSTARNGLVCGEGNPAQDTSAGHSLSRTNGLDTNDNSQDFADLPAPTPGEL